mmetsp:Transcript_35696/g.82988  ORF Transcript_35696/g.82988 Transcript_35696/m.82988 type:complete len:356 (+) Transcript_35696:402-1469(+)
MLDLRGRRWHEHVFLRRLECWPHPVRHGVLAGLWHVHSDHLGGGNLTYQVALGFHDSHPCDELRGGALHRAMHDCGRSQHNEPALAHADCGWSGPCCSGNLDDDCLPLRVPYLPGEPGPAQRGGRRVCSFAQAERPARRPGEASAKECGLRVRGHLDTPATDPVWPQDGVYDVHVVLALLMCCWTPLWQHGCLCQGNVQRHQHWLELCCRHYAGRVVGARGKRCAPILDSLPPQACDVHHLQRPNRCNGRLCLCFLPPTQRRGHDAHRRGGLPRDEDWPSAGAAAGADLRFGSFPDFVEVTGGSHRVVGGPLVRRSVARDWRRRGFLLVRGRDAWHRHAAHRPPPIRDVWPTASG